MSHGGEKEHGTTKAREGTSNSNAQDGSERQAPLEPGEPPDGGKRAWLQVLAGHLCVFNSFGCINSFGIFQAYYASALNLPPSNISWIGSLQVFLCYFLGTLSGRALDAGYFRTVLAIGLLLQVLGAFMTSLCTEYWQLILAQGICQGIGMGMVFCPAIANTATYFSRKRALAISSVACGGGTGGMVFPAIAQTLLHRIGFPWTMRVMGFVILFNATIILSLGRTRLPPREVGPLIEWTAFKEMPYLLYCVSMFFAFWGIWIAYYYVRAYARDMLGFSDNASFDLILLVNGIGVPGRLVPAVLSDRWFGPVNSLIFVIFSAGVCLFSWIATTTPSGMWILVAFYGFFGGGTQSLLQAALASLNSDMKKAGVRIGMGLTVVGVASLTGSPIGGALIESKGGSYLYAQVFAGSTMLLGSLILVCARISKTGLVFRERV
ncbi:major facilitator superfamily domain-containing protein [Phyllosticta citribraziliensis]|uniref:Major facilitator superfamily domain-containing protein n=1 Tax=Phyllosticta citribraziliensis TaxID=989973 RepID=A0ABR1LC41_9PEZI